MEENRLHFLFNKFLEKQCTPEEVEELVILLQNKEAEDTLSPRMHALWERMKKEQKEYPVDWEKMYKTVVSHEASPINKSASARRIVWRVAAAVAAVLVLSTVIYLWSEKTIHKQAPIAVAPLQQDIQPGGNKAVLTLANGATINLNQVNRGTLAQQGSSNIIKIDSGELAYQKAEKEVFSQNVQYNSLTTPRGGQYQLALPDGTKVWLNAASSIRFPTTFAGMKDRSVTITGEVYFEVAQHADKPFKVNANNMQVHVLGTHFNVNAYANEPIARTTLLEGSVKVNTKAAPGQSILLTPGQEARLNRTGGMKLVKEADIAEAVAWKNGLFVFHHDDLPSIMRKLSRWYDIQIEYEGGKIPSSHFTGAIQRAENISKVFKMLELTGGAHFEIIGRKVMISS